MKRLHLVALATAYSDPDECVKFCTSHLSKLSERNHSALLAVAVEASTRLGRFREAVHLQERLVAALKRSRSNEETAIQKAEIELLKLNAKLPSPQPSVIVELTSRLAAVKKSQYYHS